MAKSAERLAGRGRIDVTEVGLGILLDQVCNEIVRSSCPFEQGTRLMVHPQVYRCVAEARSQEVGRGLPLLFLGLELTPSNEVPPMGFKIVRLCDKIVAAT